VRTGFHPLVPWLASLAVACWLTRSSRAPYLFVAVAAFAGDDETATGTTVAGRDFFDSRYYASSQARFVSPDAPLADHSMVDPLSWNLFSYVRGNPMVGVDPTGKECLITHDHNGQTITEDNGQGNYCELLKTNSTTVGVGRDDAKPRDVDGSG
jgi:RHS repeat-associated protein